MNEALQRAITCLGAVKVAPGRYAFRIGSAYQVCSLRPLDDGEYHAVANVRMPAWWSPEERFAWHGLRGKDEGVIVPGDAYMDPRYWQRITVDLETGEEIAA